MVQTRETRSQITNFCKERDAIVKRANQICTLCASNVVIICFSICGQMFVSGDETILDTYAEVTTAKPRCTFKCTIHKTLRIFKIEKWRNKNNNSSSSSSCQRKKRGHNKVAKSPINPPNMEFMYELILVDQLQQLQEKMDGFKDIVAEQYQLLSIKQNVLESSAMAMDWSKI